MSIERRPWQENELLLALNLYSKLPFGQLHSRNPQIIRLAQYIGRTPGSVAMKLCNFAAIDPQLPRKGLTGASNLDREMWKRYCSEEQLVLLSEELMLSVFGKNSIEDTFHKEIADYCGNEVEKLLQYRIHQSFFRTAVLSNFNEKCCITGMTQRELLVASRISPWESDSVNRLNPKNGLCFNALHASAFENGLLTLDSDLKVVISPKLPKNQAHAIIWDFEGKEIELPHKYMPDLKLLENHRNNIFIQS